MRDRRVEADRVVFLDDLGINLKTARAMGMADIKVVSADQALGGTRNSLLSRCGELFRCRLRSKNCPRSLGRSSAAR